MMQVIFREDISGYYINVKGSIQDIDIVYFWNETLMTNSYPNVLIDISGMECKLRTNDFGATIDAALKEILKLAKERIAFVSHSILETAFVDVLREKLCKHGVLSRVFCNVENAEKWLRIGVEFQVNK